MQIGGASRPYYIGTRQTAVFCELQGEGYDLQDYNKLLGEVLTNQMAAKVAQEADKTYKPTGRKELTPGEMRDFVYSALVAGAKREGQPVNFDADDVADWIDQAEAEEVIKPVSTHIQLLAQRLQRQEGRPGNAPAPTLTASRGSSKKKSKS
jgi:hypothetical protein